MVTCQADGSCSQKFPEDVVPELGALPPSAGMAASRVAVPSANVHNPMQKRITDARLLTDFILCLLLEPFRASRTSCQDESRLSTFIDWAAQRYLAPNSFPRQFRPWLTVNVLMPDTPYSTGQRSTPKPPIIRSLTISSCARFGPPGR